MSYVAPSRQVGINLGLYVGVAMHSWGQAPTLVYAAPSGLGEGMSYRNLLLFFKIACIFHQKAVPLQRSGLVGVHILLEAL